MLEALAKLVELLTELLKTVNALRADVAELKQFAQQHALKDPPPPAGE